MYGIPSVLLLSFSGVSKVYNRQVTMFHLGMWCLRNNVGNKKITPAKCKDRAQLIEARAHLVSTLGLETSKLKPECPGLNLYGKRTAA
jgi:hypothetical protein